MQHDPIRLVVTCGYQVVEAGFQVIDRLVLLQTPPTRVPPAEQHPIVEDRKTTTPPHGSSAALSCACRYESGVLLS